MADGSNRLLRHVLSTTSLALEGIGLRKRSGEIFTCDLTPRAIGWLGLNRASGGRKESWVEVNPVVGVREQVLERVLARMLGERFHPYIPPTISIHLGYVMPEGTYRPWWFDSTTDIDSLASQMVRAVESYGIPFMKANADLATVLRRMEDKGFAYPHQSAYRIPVALLLLGQPDAAKACLNRELERLGSRDHPQAIAYRKFAKAFARPHSAETRTHE